MLPRIGFAPAVLHTGCNAIVMETRVVGSPTGALAFTVACN